MKEMTEKAKRNVEDFEEMRPYLRTSAALLIYVLLYSNDTSLDASYETADKFMTKFRSDLTSG